MTLSLLYDNAQQGKSKSCLRTRNEEEENENDGHCQNISSGRPSANQTKKKIWFNKVEIKEYPIILGDNPSTSDGVPLTIDWKPQRYEQWDLHDYEINHHYNQNFKRQNRRHGKHLMIPATERTQL